MTQHYKCDIQTNRRTHRYRPVPTAYTFALGNSITTHYPLWTPSWKSDLPVVILW